MAWTLDFMQHSDLSYKTLYNLEQSFDISALHCPDPRNQEMSLTSFIGEKNSMRFGKILILSKDIIYSRYAVMTPLLLFKYSKEKLEISEED